MSSEGDSSHRSYLVGLHTDMGRDYDKLVTTLSAGGISVVLFLLDSERDRTGRCIAIGAGIILTLSLLCTLTSLLTSQRAVLGVIQKLDQRETVDPRSSAWGTLTDGLNIAAGILLMVGVLLLGVFVIING